MIRNRLLFIILAFSMLTLWCGPTFGDLCWDPVALPISILENDQQDPRIISDGAGGAIICWWEGNGYQVPYGIYAQHVDALGNILWDTNGIQICEELLFQGHPRLVSDGDGGAIIVWSDEGVKAQRVDADGNPCWGSEDVVICSDAGTPWRGINLVSDGEGGAIITWSDKRWDTEAPDIYAQRVNTDGEVQWTTDGIAVCLTTTSLNYPKIVSDDAGGAIICWCDGDLGWYYYVYYGDGNIYAQRIDADGTLLWDPAGVPICTTPELQYNTRMVVDESGGAIITWMEAGYYNIFTDLFTQRVDADGDVLWTVDGIRITDDPNAYEHSNARLVRDGQGGTIITWSRRDFVDNVDVRAQHVSPGGTLLWPVGGLEINPSIERHSNVASMSDDAGGAIICWYVWGGGGIVSQRIDGDGNNLWSPDGELVVPNFDGTGTYNAQIISDGNGGIIATWEESYWEYAYETIIGDIYAQRMNPADCQRTVRAEMTCLPYSGTVPFSTNMTATLTNLYDGLTRRIAARIDVSLGGGTSFSNWKSGWTNVPVGGEFSSSWNQNIPALGSTVGNNIFTLVAEDVTPSPYNQPGHLPSGETDIDLCTVTGVAP